MKLPLDKETQTVLETVSRYVDSLPPELGALTGATTLWTERGAGLSLWLPFWLNEEFARSHLLPQAREMAIANRFGQLFCLLQDGVVDDHLGTKPEILILIDAFYFKLLHGYQKLFPAQHRFWEHFETYWLEYLQATAWEKLHHHKCIKAYREEDLEWLARKLSPIKFCCTGMAMLAKRDEEIPHLNRMIEHLQLGVQMIDDLEDWEEDLRVENYTYPLTLVHLEAGRSVDAPLPTNDIREILWSKGVADHILQLAKTNILQSLEEISHLSLSALKGWIQAYQAKAFEQLGEARKAVIQQPELEFFRKNGRCVVLNVTTSRLFEVDHQAADLIESFARGAESEDSSGQDELRQELDAAGILTVLSPPKPEDKPPLLTLYLNVSTGCNLACSYCYAANKAYRGAVGFMSEEVGERAVDLLIQSSGPEKKIKIIFFGGEPLLNADLIEHIIHYGKRRCAPCDKEIRYRIVTNGTLITAPIIDLFRQHEVAVEVSLDGPPDVQDRKRPTVQGKGTYQRVVDNICAMQEAGVESISIRATLSALQPSPEEILEHLLTLKPGSVSMQFVRPVKDMAPFWLEDDIPILMKYQEKLAALFSRYLSSGELIPYSNLLQSLTRLHRQVRLSYYCAAGVTMAAVAPDGKIYPCFRFTDEPSTTVGDVFSGIDDVKMLAYRRNIVNQQTPCQTCWARYLCGGNCRYENFIESGHISRPNHEQCVLKQHNWEVNIQLYADIKRNAPELAKRIGEKNLTNVQIARCDR